MIIGAITSKDVLSHPMAMVVSFGIVRYLYFIFKALSPKTCHFLNLIVH